MRADLTNKTKQILLGSLLGDGSLQKQKKSINALFRERHALSQKSYILWKVKHLEFFDIKYKSGKRLDKRTNKYYFFIDIWSKTHPILTNYYKLFYPKGKKIITHKILDQIKLLGLAIWYMDDGYFRNESKNIKLGTEGYTFNENKIILKWFIEKWNINPTIHKDRKNYYLFFNTEQTNKLLKIIVPFIPRPMIYKLGHFHPKNLEQINNAYDKRRKRENKRYYNLMKDSKYRKKRKENQKKWLNNSEHRKKYNEYHRNWYKRKKEKLNREKAVFTDIDGTLITEIPHINNPDDVKLLPTVGESIKSLNNEFLVIAITNKSSIEYGYSSKENLLEIFKRIRRELLKYNAKIDAFYYCPHSEKNNCPCRKPKIKMIFDTLKKFKKIDLNKSWIIGDKTRDIQLGINIKKRYNDFKSIGILTGYGLKDKEFNAKPDYIVPNFLEAVKIIKRRLINLSENRCPKCNRKLQHKKVGYVCKNWKCKNYWKLGKGKVIIPTEVI